MLTSQPLLFEIEAKRIFPKPFLKWAGGKSQLLELMTASQALQNVEIKTSDFREILD